MSRVIRFLRVERLIWICYLNKEKAVERLMGLLTRALHQPKIRKPTRLSKTAKAARLNDKRLQGEKKDSRKRNFDI